MARTIKGHEAGGERVFIPAAFDNRKDTNPVRLHIKNPTLREKRQLFQKALDFSGAANTEGVAFDGGSAFSVYEEAVELFVHRVDNYTGAAGEIKNGADLVTHGEIEIILEAATEILGDNDEKKSEEPLGSTPAKTPPLSTTAAAVSQQAQTKKETVEVEF